LFSKQRIARLISSANHGPVAQAITCRCATRGLGVDAYIAGIHAETPAGIFGLYTVTILDAETYHAAAAVHIAPDNLRHVTCW
jgi:hypothetical protein